MQNKARIDSLDRKILSFLLKDARKSFLEIARECGVSGAAIHQRVKKMEESGVITGSSFSIRPSAIGMDVCAFVTIMLSENNKYPEVIQSLKEIPEIVECHFVTGSAALLVKIYCANNDHLMEVVLNTIQKIPYIRDTQTLLSLDESFSRNVWVKDELAKEITWKTGF